MPMKPNPPQEERVRKAKSSNKILTYVLIVLLIVIIILLLLRSCGNDSGGQVLEPDYELVDPDPNATQIPGQQEKPPENITSGGGSVSLVYSDVVTVDLTTGKVGLYYQNPSNSTHSIVVQIIIQRGEDQYLVAESGALHAGYMVTELELAEGTQLAAGGYEGFLKLLFFDPETGERAMVDTNIPATINVQ